MIEWKDTLDFSFENPSIDKNFTESSLFFDIETTGFSPATSSVYLIGCGMRKGNRLTIQQFFAESPREEANVISAFLALAEGFDTIITFNGIGFDIPFLTAKCKKLKLTEHFDSFHYLDIYKAVSKLKNILGLPNYKQKSIEAFLGIAREDAYNGGELIEVYHAYVKNPNKEGLFLLKQHNYEDVLGMPKLLSILSYSAFFESECTVTKISASEYTTIDRAFKQKELLFTLQSESSIPKRISCRFEEFYLTAEQNTARLTIKLYDGELKLFFPNYKDYYYLPAEDAAYPKSVALGVAKSDRKQATASTCYTKKSGIFLPQYTSIVKPAFRQLSPKEKKSYFELSDSFLQDAPLCSSYVRHIFQLLVQKKIP